MKRVRLTAIYDVSFPFIKGGGQRRFYEILKRFNSSKYQIKWFTFNAWDKSKKIISKDGIEYISIGNIPNLYNHKGKRSKIEPLVFAFRVILNFKKICNTDYIWVGQWPLLHLFPLIILKPFFSYKLVVDYWEVWDLSYWRNYSAFLGYFGWIFQYLLLLLISKSAIIVTDSIIEKDRIKKLVKSSNVKVIPNGISFRYQNNYKNITSRDNDLVYFGRLKDHKNVEIIIDAINYIKEKYKKSLQVMIIGDGPMRKVLENKCNTLKLKNITFTGFVEDQELVHKHLENSKLSVIPIVSGGGAGNLTILELMSCGTPCIIFDVNNGIDKNLIIDGVNGFILKKISFIELGTKIFNFISDYRNNNTIHSTTKDYSKNFTWHNSYLKYLKIFR